MNPLILLALVLSLGSIAASREKTKGPAVVLFLLALISSLCYTAKWVS